MSIFLQLQSRDAPFTFSSKQLLRLLQYEKTKMQYAAHNILLDTQETSAFTGKNFDILLQHVATMCCAS